MLDRFCSYAAQMGSSTKPHLLTTGIASMRQRGTFQTCLCSEPITSIMYTPVSMVGNHSSRHFHQSRVLIAPCSGILLLKSRRNGINMITTVSAAWLILVQATIECAQSHLAVPPMLTPAVSRLE